jgi:hypothetical protein
MIKASALPKRYKIGKTHFYERRKYLIELGYDLEPTRQGRTSLYSNEQIQLLDEFDQHIKAQGTMEGFPTPAIDVKDEREEADSNINLNNSHNGSVQQNGQSLVNESVTTSETNGHHQNGLVTTEQQLPDREAAEEDPIPLETSPLEDIQEKNFQAVDKAAQYIAAQNLATLNYLIVDYMREGDFTVDGLHEQVQASEEAVDQSFTSVMQSPDAVAKKLLRRKRNRQKP